MLFMNAAVFAGVYLATLWYCRGKYVRCIELLYDMRHRLESIYSQRTLENIESPRDYITLLRNEKFQTVELYRASNLFPKDLQKVVQNCAHSEFLMESHSYLLFLAVICFCETNHIDAGIYFVGYFQEIFNSEEFNLLKNVIQENSKRLMEIAVDKIEKLSSLKFPFCTM